MFFLVCLNYVYRISPMATFFSLLVQSKEGKRNTPPVSVLFFTFANFYGQFVNLPLRGFGHDKLTLKSSRKRSGTEDGEIKNKTQSVMILITALWLFSPKNSIFCSSLLNCPSGCEICREIFLVSYVYT